MGVTLSRLLGWDPIRHNVRTTYGGTEVSCSLVGPLDAHADFDDAWKAILLHLKESHRVRSISDDFIQMTVYCPGQRVGMPEREFVIFQENSYLEKARKRISTDVFTDVDDGINVCFRKIYQIRENPLMLEAWGIYPGPMYLSAEMRTAMCETLQTIWKRLDIVRDRPVPSARTTQSKFRGHELCIMSDPIGEYLDFERLWAEWLDVIKYPAGSRLDDVETINDSQFNITAKICPGDPGEVVEQQFRFFLDKRSGRVRAEMGDPVTVMMWTVIHRDPLQVEMWAVPWVLSEDGPPVQEMATEFWRCLQLVAKRGRNRW